MLKISLATFLLFWLPSFTSIDVTVTTTAPHKGEIHLAVYASAAAFAADQPDYGKVFKLQSSQVQFPLAVEGLPPGQYVIAGFHDVNGNGKLDKNMMGVPTEPYGFSKEPASKWSRPAWNEVAENVKGKGSDHRIVMKTWKER